MAVTEPIFTTVTLVWQTYVKNHTEFHENPTDRLVAASRSRTEGYTCCPQKALFYFVKNA